MSELLAPAGNYESFIAAVSNGCDAVYLACEKFGARAYAKNFSFEDLDNVIKYAHLRNVKVYVTMNTICFDSELEEAYKQLDTIYSLGVDGVIIQDLALIDYCVKKCPEMEAHASTQMGLDDEEGVLFVKELGCKRAVLGRETPIDLIKSIKEKTKMSIEIFVHGALCVSFSGNCLMSGLIGYRSGNRGRCVGSCRKQYKLINTSTNEVISDSYILSMKDLNTTSHINELMIADSLKIEGRMKEPYYVANIIKSYRSLMDKNGDLKEINYNLSKTFNRTFTKGYIFGEDKKNISNTLRPNHMGYHIGYISGKKKGKYEVTLSDTLNQNDAIRIINDKEEVNMTVIKLYDAEDNLINKANSRVYLDIVEKLNIGDEVYKTKDVKYIDVLNKTYPSEYKRLPINIYLNGTISTNLSMTISYEDIYVTVESDYIIEEAKNPLSKEKIKEQLSRLNDTPYILDHLELYISDNSFVPNKILNDLRRKAIIELNSARLKNPVITTYEYKQDKISFPLETPRLSVFCNTENQYRAAVDMDIDIIYYKNNVFRRNMVTYNKVDGYVLVGGYGGIEYFKDTNYVISDFSLNVVNAKTVNILHNKGVNRVTISHEINKQEINELITNYYEYNGGYPNLEMIIYGRQDLMHTNYCPLKVNNLCGKCKKNEYVISDEYGQFPILSHEDCTTTILNGKILNLLDEMPNIKNINVFRLQFTKEDYNESKAIIEKAKDKLYNNSKIKTFDESINTRGHFNKEIL